MSRSTEQMQGHRARLAVTEVASVLRSRLPFYGSPRTSSIGLLQRLA